MEKETKTKFNVYNSNKVLSLLLSAIRYTTYLQRSSKRTKWSFLEVTATSNTSMVNTNQVEHWIEYY